MRSRRASRARVVDLAGVRSASRAELATHAQMNEREAARVRGPFTGERHTVISGGRGGLCGGGCGCCTVRFVALALLFAVLFVLRRLLCCLLLLYDCGPGRN